MRNVDLHTHSCYSDGTDRPKRIVEAAVQAQLSAVALTDHDTTLGLPEFIQAGAAAGIEAIPGVEISSIYGSRELHIVGLYIDCENPTLASFLEEQRRERHERARAMAIRLSSLGYPVTMPELENNSWQPIGRPHFARYLAEHYRFASIAEVFDKLLKRGCPGYVQRKLPSPEAAIDVIQAAGGIAVWAHPISANRNERAWLKRMFTRLREMHLDGVEAYYSSFSPQQTAGIRELAADFDLVLSGGSDYHGSTQPNIQIGSGGGELAVPEELLAIIKARRRIRP